MSDGLRRRWLVPMVAAAVHAAAVILAVAVNVASVRMDILGHHALDAVADAMVWILCLPLVVLLRVGRVDIFFMLLPLNTAIYALAFWGAWACFRGRRRPAG